MKDLLRARDSTRNNNEGPKVLKALVSMIPSVGASDKAKLIKEFGVNSGWKKTQEEVEDVILPKPLKIKLLKEMMD